MQKPEKLPPQFKRRQELEWLVEEAEENATARKRGEGRQTYNFSDYSYADIGYLAAMASIHGMRLCISFREENQQAYFYFEFDKNMNRGVV